MIMKRGWKKYLLRHTIVYFVTHDYSDMDITPAFEYCNVCSKWLLDVTL